MILKYLLPSLLLLASCSERISSDTALEHSDDYVLIEFASKLEEDYQKPQKIPQGPETEIRKSQ